MTMPIPDGSVVITPAQMYLQLGETSKNVEALAGEVRALRSEVSPALQDIRKDVADHETTLRSLVSNVTVVRTQLKAAWAACGLLFVGLGVLAGLLSAFHGAN